MALLPTDPCFKAVAKLLLLKEARLEMLWAGVKMNEWNFSLVSFYALLLVHIAVTFYRVVLSDVTFDTASDHLLNAVWPKKMSVSQKCGVSSTPWWHEIVFHNSTSILDRKKRWRMIIKDLFLFASKSVLPSPGIYTFNKTLPLYRVSSWNQHQDGFLQTRKMPIPKT